MQVKSYIKDIIIFNELGSKREVVLQQGVNIITGESKTGKSALVEIIDYCLCSTRCTIPKGKITDFAYLYCVVMLIGDSTYIIARESWGQGGKMYFSKEKEEFNFKALDLSYFTDKPKLSSRDAQREIECAFGLFVTNMKTDPEKQGKKASLRNMVSYLFQHQNLMASKFALFYRFSDFYKRKDVIEQFPVFAGIIGQEYYSDLIRLNNLQAQLKQKKKKQKANQKTTVYIKEKLGPLLKDYYALLNMDFPENLAVTQMIKIAKHLPEFDESQLFGETKITRRYTELNRELERLTDKERDILLKIDHLQGTSETGVEFSDMLKELKAQTKAAPVRLDKYVCPLCGQNCQDIVEKDKKLSEATEWLDKELAITDKYTADFSEDRRKLEAEYKRIEDEIKATWTQIKTLESKFLTSKELISKRQKVNFAKSTIMLYLEMIDSGIFVDVDAEIDNLTDEINMLREKIAGFDVEAQKSKAQAFLSENMNRLSQTLDFEEEYTPLNLNFGLVDETFDIYQLQDNSKIYLYEMGSGANWVSCHIALFLSFLRYFASKPNSPMPLIMFFDQPSQVYFPQGNDDYFEDSQTDVTAVSNMYQTIFDEINSIGNDTGILPQIIVVDHVSGKNLKCSVEFAKYVRANWRDGHALI